MFRFEIGSGFGEPGGTPPPKILRSTPPAYSLVYSIGNLRNNEEREKLQGKLSNNLSILGKHEMQSIIVSILGNIYGK